MRCPTDGATLVLSERAGVEIDYCPDCRGVWLDRGKLDKIIDRSPSAQGIGRRDDDPRYDPRYDDRHDGHHDRGRKRRKREGWLGELFD